MLGGGHVRPAWAVFAQVACIILLLKKVSVICAIAFLCSYTVHSTQHVLSVHFVVFVMLSAIFTHMIILLEITRLPRCQWIIVVTSHL